MCQNSFLKSICAKDQPHGDLPNSWIIPKADNDNFSISQCQKVTHHRPSQAGTPCRGRTASTRTPAMVGGQLGCMRRLGSYTWSEGSRLKSDGGLVMTYLLLEDSDKLDLSLNLHRQHFRLLRKWADIDVWKCRFINRNSVTLAKELINIVILTF